MLTQKTNPKSGKKEYALVSISSPGKVLKWFGSEKPSEETVKKEEARVEFFKHKSRKRSLLTGRG